MVQDKAFAGRENERLTASVIYYEAFEWHARLWAQRACETRWEALTAVRRICAAGEGVTYTEARCWAIDFMRTEPAIVSIDIETNRLDEECVQAFLLWGEETSPREFVVSTDELAGCPTTVKEVGTLYEYTQLMYVLGLTKKDLLRLQREGKVARLERGPEVPRCVQVWPWPFDFQDNRKYIDESRAIPLDPLAVLHSPALMRQ